MTVITKQAMMTAAAAATNEASKFKDEVQHAWQQTLTAVRDNIAGATSNLDVDDSGRHRRHLPPKRAMIIVASTGTMALLCFVVSCNMLFGGSGSGDSSTNRVLSVTKPEEKCVMPEGTEIATIRDPDGNKRFDMVVRSEDFMSKYMVDKGYWEIRDVQDIPDLAKPFNTTLPLPSEGAFYDVGANIGYYSFLHAHAGYQVIAFEPLPSNLAIYKATMCLNPTLAKRITLHEMGLSNQELQCRLIGSVNARTKKYLYGVGTLECPTATQPLKPCDPQRDLICEPVPVSTLDKVISGKSSSSSKNSFPKAAILKMDVEGHELQVLQGGELFFEKIQPTLVQFEYKGHKQKIVADWLVSHGYGIGDGRGHDGNTVGRRQPNLGATSTK